MKRTRLRRWSASRTMTAALVLFAMLCGLSLVVATYPQMPARHAVRVERAIESLDRATHALEATNYGDTREYLQAARRSLERITQEDKR